MAAGSTSRALLPEVLETAKPIRRVRAGRVWAASYGKRPVIRVEVALEERGDARHLVKLLLLLGRRRPIKASSLPIDHLGIHLVCGQLGVRAAWGAGSLAARNRSLSVTL